MSDRKATGSCSDRPSLSTDQSHHDVELAPGSVFVHRVELWALVPALRAADPVVLVHLDDLIAHAGCHLPQLLTVLSSSSLTSTHFLGVMATNPFLPLCSPFTTVTRSPVSIGTPCLRLRLGKQRHGALWA